MAAESQPRRPVRRLGTAPVGPRSLAYAQFIDRYRRWILLFSILIAAGAAALVTRLPIHADISYLLPPNAKSVVHLRAIEARARVNGTLIIAVTSDDPAARRASALRLKDQIEHLNDGQVSHVEFDERAARTYGWNNRFLFASLEDLKKARDSLQAKIDKAKLSANPLYVDLDDDDAKPNPGSGAQPAAEASGTDDLRKKLADAETLRDDPGEKVSTDGHLQILVIHTAFSSGDTDRDEHLLATMGGLVNAEMKRSPTVKIGIAGDIVVSVAEHDAILNGMLFATAITVALVLLALLWFYRSVRTVGAVSWALVVGTLMTFAFTKLTIGHLNLATAFLSSIVVGNGINFGILLAARFREARRAGEEVVDALATAIAGSLMGTLTAALTAAVAYGSLVTTVFRGFRHFGIIGGVGILLCWLAAYTVLPAALALLAHHQPKTPPPEPPIGRLLAHLLPRRLLPVAIVMVASMALAGVVSYRYLANDPFENNQRNLASDGKQISQERAWMAKVDKAFGQGISGGFVIALPNRAEVLPLRDRLRAVDEGKDEDHKLFRRVGSLDDLLPDHQPEKLALLADIRRMLDDDTINSLSPEDKKLALALRPPANLRVLGDNDVPEEIAEPFIEADGSRGKIILAMSGKSYEIWYAHDIIKFDDAVQALGLPPDAMLGGSAFVFADVIRSMERDGPRATLASLFGAVLVVMLVVGVRRHGVVTIVCGFAGTLFMLALAAALGLRVNFLDFVALPLTIGIGIDYAVNIVTREKQEGDVRRALMTAGGAVLLCSYTTMIGYGALLLSANKGIRSFGLAAILGEATCLISALILAPALLGAWAARTGKTGK